MMQSNLKIAITGGIGSGKSTVAKIISEQGYTVLSCDEIYARLLKDKNFLLKLSKEFGDILNERGELDRKKLSSIVFSDEKKLHRLNEITHPEIIFEALRQMTGSGVFFCEVPLLFEEGLEKYFDNVIVVLRDKNTRVEFVSKRDNMSAQDVLLRMDNQYNYEDGKFEKYYVINNNSDLSDLRNQTLKTVEKINKELL